MARAPGAHGSEVAGGDGDARQVYLGEALDTEHIDAGYDAGVLTLRIPVAAQAKPRRIEINSGQGARRLTS